MYGQKPIISRTGRTRGSFQLRIALTTTLRTQITCQNFFTFLKGVFYSCHQRHRTADCGLGAMPHLVVSHLHQLSACPRPNKQVGTLSGWMKCEPSRNRNLPCSPHLTLCCRGARLNVTLLTARRRRRRQRRSPHTRTARAVMTPPTVPTTAAADNCS